MLTRNRIAGMNFHYFRHSFERFLDDMVALDIEAIELWAAMPHFPVDDSTLEDARRIGRQIRERGLALLCLTPEQCIYPINVASENGRLRDRSIAYFLRNLDFALELECPKLLVTPGWGYADQPREEAWKRSLDGLAAIARRAEATGIELLLEPLSPTESNIVTTAAELKTMIDAIGSPAVTAILDTNAMAVVGDSISAYHETLGGLLRHVHLIDGTPEGHLAWGDGNLDLRACLAALDGIGYDGFMTLEFTTPAYWLDPLAPMRKSIAAIEAALAELAREEV